MSAATAPRVGLDGLLGRLDRVQRSGQGWRADCPSGHRTRSTLSIAQGDGGGVLLHCFAGCSTGDVLAALGLTLHDVMPERLADPTQAERRAARDRFRLASVQAAAGVLAAEAYLVELAAFDLLAGRVLDPADTLRVRHAAERIAAAREALA